MERLYGKGGKMKGSRWTVVIVGVIALLMVGSMVWASAPASPSSAPVQAYDAQNADKVDGLHASKQPTANTLLALNSNKKFPASVIPAYTKAQSDARYLNDDRKETISASVNGPLLTISNAGGPFWGSDRIGLFANAEQHGVYGYSSGGIGVYADSDAGVGLLAESDVGNIIEGWDKIPGVLRFYVSNSGDVHANGSFYAGQDVSVSALLRVGQYSSAPACDGTTEGSIYYNTTDKKFYGCDGTTWQAFH
jgi:hypothetical protein